MTVKDSFRKFHIAQYNRNAVVQLIAASGVGFVGVHLLWITMIVYAVPEARATELTLRHVGMPGLDLLRERWWTVFTYAWCHRGFWEWLSNMLWLYCFGNVVQMLVGYKQIIPLFLYSVLAGGLAYAGVQLLPGMALPSGTLYLGGQAGIMAMMVAAITLSPKYRFYLTDHFSIPLLLVAGIFSVLMVLSNMHSIPALVLLAAGGLTGLAYVRLLQAGYRPGGWVYKLTGRMGSSFTPPSDRRQAPGPRTYSHNTRDNSQQVIDRILDKINEKGYESLSREEKDILRKAAE
jgi:membrane associated rhomboid family serine protease